MSTGPVWWPQLAVGSSQPAVSSAADCCLPVFTLSLFSEPPAPAPSLCRRCSGSLHSPLPVAQAP